MDATMRRCIVASARMPASLLSRVSDVRFDEEEAGTARSGEEWREAARHGATRRGYRRARENVSQLARANPAEIIALSAVIRR